MRFFLKCVLGFILFSIFQAWAYSAQLQITPVRMYLDSDSPIGAFTLENQDTEPVMIQLSTFKWSQKEGKDIYEKTRDILANPPIVTVPAGESQIIRVGLKNADLMDRSQELTYRIFFTQIIEAEKAHKKASLIQTRVRLNIPMFFSPKSVVHKLSWEIQKRDATKKMKEHEFKLILSNEGNVHMQITKIKIYPSQNSKKPIFTKETFSYILPRQSTSWDVVIPATASTEHLKIVAETDTGDVAEYAKSLD